MCRVVATRRAFGIDQTLTSRLLDPPAGRVHLLNYTFDIIRAWNTRNVSLHVKFSAARSLGGHPLSAAERESVFQETRAFRRCNCFCPHVCIHTRPTYCFIGAGTWPAFVWRRLLLCFQTWITNRSKSNRAQSLWCASETSIRVRYTLFYLLPCLSIHKSMKNAMKIYRLIVCDRS